MRVRMRRHLVGGSGQLLSARWVVDLDVRARSQPGSPPGIFFRTGGTCVVWRLSCHPCVKFHQRQLPWAEATGSRCLLKLLRRSLISVCQEGKAWSFASARVGGSPRTKKTRCRRGTRGKRSTGAPALWGFEPHAVYRVGGRFVFPRYPLGVM